VQIIKKFTNILYWLLIIMLIIVAGTAALSSFDISGGTKLYSVQSGSMEPEIKTGSVVLSQPQTIYFRGDIITFKAEKDRTVKNPRYTTTHRVHELQEAEGKLMFITKGDANDSPDGTPITQDLILGKVLVAVPYLGYLVSFAKTEAGFILLIIVPATLIIYSELVSIKNEAKKLIEERKKRKLTAKEKVVVAFGETEMAVGESISSLFDPGGKK